MNYVIRHRFHGKINVLMANLEETFAQIQRIAHELVDAEAQPAWTPTEYAKVNKARENALKCMRHIGSRTLEKIGRDDDWGT